MSAYTLMLVASIFATAYFGLLILCKAIEHEHIPAWTFITWGLNVTAVVTHFIGMW